MPLETIPPASTQPAANDDTGQEQTTSTPPQEEEEEEDGGPGDPTRRERRAFWQKAYDAGCMGPGPGETFDEWMEGALDLSATGLAYRPRGLNNQRRFRDV